MELKCVERVSRDYGIPEMLSLWLELKENKTPEAKFVKKLDKYDMHMQGKQYYNVHKNEEICNFVEKFENLREEIEGEKR